MSSHHCRWRGKHRHLGWDNAVLIFQELERLPETSAEFYRDWRRCVKSSQERYQLLLQLGPQNLGRIFRADLAFGLLSEFLTVLTENACIEDWDSILEILKSLSDTKRFGLNLELLSGQEKECCRHLFEKLQKMGTGHRAVSGVPHASEEEGPAVTQLHCQGDGPDERKLRELMCRYLVH